ncbi:MAG: ABC transporter ATP-binding protein [Hyphomicrobiales bacterium]|nr:ABC transporter ATP-binding protein [Hyphomicrobiales bacterium]MCP4999193.1 ABC transporter ATP-binding protein [Hyphomicrobiales bacterium]
MLLALRDVRKSFTTEEGPVDVLKGISLDLDAGQHLALTGESGSGKSTLLHLIGGLDGPDSGEIKVAGADIAHMDDPQLAALRRGKIGLVFQQFNLIPSLTVAQNLAFHARLAGRLDPDWNAHLTERLGLAECLHRYPEQLSGGQQQRVAIGRTLAVRPDLILADEPTGNLDEDTGDAVIDLMLQLVADVRAGFILVTHSTRLAGLLDRRLHLTHGRLQ